MSELSNKELKRMKEVLIQLNKLNTAKVDLKKIDKEEFPEQIALGLKKLNNLANYFFTKAKEAYHLDEIDANAFNGNKTIDQIRNIVLFLGIDTVYKIFERSAVPFFVSKTIRNIQKEQYALEAELVKKQKQAKNANVEKKEENSQNARMRANKKAKKLLKKFSKYKIFRQNMSKNKSGFANKKTDISK